MPRYATTICLAFVCLGSFAQGPGLGLEKPAIKDLLPHISYIPAKSFTSLVYTGRDSVSFYGPRTCSVKGFYMDRFEVTNKEYREFVYYVRDSIAHTLLSHFSNGTTTLDWSQVIDWKSDRLDPIMLSPEESILGRKEIDPGKIVYAIDFFGAKEITGIYPDTLVWISDFTYANNEPLVKQYFSYSSYDNYPVVGVSLKQAMAFCQWKTRQIDQSIKGQAITNTQLVVRLPSNAEWESAAIEEKDTLGLFSVSQPYHYNFGTITDGNGFALKGYKDDGYFYTAPVKSFPPGPYGLYDMKGNVAEWTSTARDEIMRVEVKPEKMKSSFIVKGGGWNSTPFYLQAGVCQFFSAEAAHSFIGFRYMVDAVKK